MAQDDGRPPLLGADTLQSRAANSGQIFEARQRARQDIADEFETQSPEEIPIRRRDGGFGASEGFFDRALPEEAAFDLNPQFENQDLGPQDVAPLDGGGFGPTQEVQRQAAAFDLDEQFGAVDIGFGDVEQRDDGGFGLGMGAQREVTAARIENQTPLQDVDPQDDLRPDNGGDGFQLTEPTAERLFDLDRSFF